MLNAWQSDAATTGMAAPPSRVAAELGWREITSVWLRAAWFIVPAALAGGAGCYALSLTMIPVYQAQAVLLLDRPDPGRLGNPADSPASDSQQRATTVHSQIETIRGDTVVTNVIATLHLADAPMFHPAPGFLSRWTGGPTISSGARPDMPALSPSTLVEAYLAHLTVDQDPDTYILRVGFRSSDPILAARVANAHVASYLSWLKDQQTQGFDRVRSWLDQAVATARQRLDVSEAAVRDLNSRGVMTDIDGRSALDQGLSKLTTDLAAAQTAMVEAQARADEIVRLQRAGEGAGIAAMSGSQVLEVMEASSAQARADLAAMRSRFGADYPGRAEIEARAAETRAAVDREVADLIAGERSKATINRATVANLSAALDRMNQQVVARAGDRSQLAQLQSKADTDRSVYLSLLAKLRSYDELDVLAAADVTELSPASVPAVPLSPRRGLFAAFGFLIAGGLAAAASVWRVSRRDVVRRTLDATELTGLRCLGIMPAFRTGRRNGIDRLQPSYAFFREELRSLCALLTRERPAGQAGTTLLVTSSLPGEGKSTFCRELGQLAAESGVRTLIVRAGRDGTLLPRNAPAAGSAPRLVEGHTLLFVVDWTVPPISVADFGVDPAIEAWRREFGLLLFDAPPVSATAESLILAPMVDATLVLARVDQTPRALLANVTEQLGRSGGRIVGFFLTFVRLDRQQGMMPSDPGYYFKQNRAYHRQLAGPRSPEQG